MPLWQHLRRLSSLDPEAQHIPAPMIQIFGGGRHAGNRIDIQDYLILARRARSFPEATSRSRRSTWPPAGPMVQQGKLNGVADEGGVWPDFTANEEGLELLTRAIESRRSASRRRYRIALDVAATSFYGRWRLPPGAGGQEPVDARDDRTAAILGRRLPDRLARRPPRRGRRRRLCRDHPTPRQVHPDRR